MSKKNGIERRRERRMQDLAFCFEKAKVLASFYENFGVDFQRGGTTRLRLHLEDLRATIAKVDSILESMKESIVKNFPSREPDVRYQSPEKRSE